MEKMELRQIGMLVFPASIPIITGHEPKGKKWGSPTERKAMALRWAIWRANRRNRINKLDSKDAAS